MTETHVWDYSPRWSHTRGLLNSTSRLKIYISGVFCGSVKAEHLFRDCEGFQLSNTISSKILISYLITLSTSYAAGVYDAMDDGLNAFAADVRTVCATFRAAAKRQNSVIGAELKVPRASV